MIDRQKGNIVIECDGCGDVLDTNTADFNSARNLMKRNDWRAAKDGDEWKHFCSGCKDNYPYRYAS